MMGVRKGAVNNLGVVMVNANLVAAAIFGAGDAELIMIMVVRKKNEMCWFCFE